GARFAFVAAAATTAATAAALALRIRLLAIGGLGAAVCAGVQVAVGCGGFGINPALVSLDRCSGDRRCCAVGHRGGCDNGIRRIRRGFVAAIAATAPAVTATATIAVAGFRGGCGGGGWTLFLGVAGAFLAGLPTCLGRCGEFALLGVGTALAAALTIAVICAAVATVAAAAMTSTAAGRGLGLGSNGFFLNGWRCRRAGQPAQRSLDQAGALGIGHCGRFGLWFGMPRCGL